MHYLTTHQLADAPFEYALKYLGGGDFDKAVVVVRGRAKDRLGCSAWQWITDACLSFDTTNQILQCYTNLAKERKIPEYNPHDRASIDAVVPAVMQCSGASYDVVHACVYELYQATKEGQIANAAIAFPQTAEQYDKERQAPKHVDNTDSPLGTVLKWGKWLLILGVAGVAIYEVDQVTGFLRAIVPGRSK